MTRGIQDAICVSLVFILMGFVQMGYERELLGGKWKTNHGYYYKLGVRLPRPATGEGNPIVPHGNLYGYLYQPLKIKSELISPDAGESEVTSHLSVPGDLP